MDKKNDTIDSGFATNLEPVQSFQKAVASPSDNNIDPNRPVSTVLMTVGLVGLIVLVLIVVFLKLCWTNEKFFRQNPRLDAEVVSGRHISKYGKYGNFRRQSDTIPMEFNYVRRFSKSSNEKTWCQKQVSCACTFNGGPTTSRQKGWKRNKDNEPYGPT